MAISEQTRREDAIDRWLDCFKPYQKRWIGEQARIAVMVKARQIGISFAIAAQAVLESVKEGSTNIILSASQDLSDEVLRKAKQHAHALAEAGHDGAFLSGENHSRITFPNGGRVIALPANARTARSFSGNIHFDEAAYHTDFDAIWDAAAAMAIREGYKIRLVSTPNGAHGRFHKWATAIPNGWGLHRVTVEQAITEGMPVNIKDLWELAGHDERVFAQWFQCSFLDSQMQYIPTALLDRALEWIGPYPSLDNPDVGIHAGLDIGRNNDLTVLTVIATYRGIAYVLAIMSCQRTKFRAQRNMVREARELFKWDTLHIDRTGLGMDTAEEFLEAWGEDEVRCVDFTLQSKADLATRGLRWFRDSRVRFPKNNEGRELHREAQSLKRLVTQAGNVCFDTPRSSSGHGDRLWSFLLALRGSGEPTAPRGIGAEPVLAVA